MNLRDLKHRIFYGWSFVRWLRMGLAAIIAYESAMSGDLLFGALSSVLMLQAILNVGCCTGGACFVPQKTKEKPAQKEITYEEIK
jgi:hypothetical protein